MRPEDYEKLKGPRTEELFRVKFDSFSAGSAGGCRRALQRLVGWLQANGLQHLIMDHPPWLDVTGGLLSLWLGDERAASRGGSQGGGSMALSLRSSVTWGVAHMGLIGLDVTANILKSAAAPSVATPKHALARRLRSCSACAHTALALTLRLRSRGTCDHTTLALTLRLRSHSACAHLSPIYSMGRRYTVSCSACALFKQPCKVQIFKHPDLLRPCFLCLGFTVFTVPTASKQGLRPCTPAPAAGFRLRRAALDPACGVLTGCD